MINSVYSTMRPSRTIAVLTTAAALTITLAACSNSSDATATASVAASSAPASADPATAAADAACTQILEGKLTQADAEELAKKAGLASRIGSVDGKPNALTMDYNPQRVTFTIEGGTVTECTVG
jgi:ABC-type transport system substrate-binding protein